MVWVHESRCVTVRVRSVAGGMMGIGMWQVCVVTVHSLWWYDGSDSVMCDAMRQEPVSEQPGGLDSSRDRPAHSAVWPVSVHAWSMPVVTGMGAGCRLCV